MKSMLSRYLPWFFERYRKRAYFNNFGSKLDSLVLEIWKQNREELITFDNEELAGSIWGFMLKGRMSDAQIRIFSQLNPMMKQILDALKEDAVSRDKVIFVEYLVRNLVASKFAYLRDVTLLRKKTRPTETKITCPMNLH